MGLDVYARKRDFAKTPEPSDAPVVRSEASTERQFVIQRHDARRLHYDFRLELEGVLKSWAVPKGPSLDPGERRLAVATEDHPLTYASFEGVIPRGQYGAGDVLLWDRGTWRCSTDPQKALEKGRLEFELDGEKLRGQWRLVRMPRKGNERQESWLLIKRNDDYARQGAEAEIVERAPHSVVSLQGPGGALADPIPASMAPQLATLVDSPPHTDAWLHEVKYDGYRLWCVGDGQGLRWWTRSGQDWTPKFESLSRALASLNRRSFVLDGEVVVLDNGGRSNFAALQQALSTGTGELVFFAFDLLYLEGRDLRERPLLERKEALSALLDQHPEVHNVRYSDHVIGQGPDFFQHASKLELEGIISKRIDAPYRAGRSHAWQKVKCRHRQEMVIVGWVPGQGLRAALGALLLAVRDDTGNLRYVGKVGTGFNASSIQEVRATLHPLEQDMPSVAVDLPPRQRRQVHWVEPRCVAEIVFAGWTGDGHVRQAAFVGLRQDKPAAEVHREVPLTTREALQPRGSVRSEVAGVRLTHPEKLLFPAMGLTKSDLASYYEAVATWMLPTLRHRPLTLVRCPDGQSAECFHQKRAHRSTPKSMPRVAVKPGVEYMQVQELPDLVTLVQLGVLEIHVWGSRSTGPGIGFPDLLVFDLDPDEDVPWANVVATAEALRTRLGHLGLHGFARATGGKGLHVVAPIEPTLAWDRAKAFTHAIALEFVRHAPEHYTDRLTKSRRKGRIFIDYLRNAADATAIATYSVRAREEAPVAAPILWSELQTSSHPPRWSIDDVVDRVGRGIDPWQDFDASRRPVTRDALQQLELDV